VGREIPADIAPGSTVLVHRRLAILDLSDAGWQPMTTADQRYAVVLNGEIYNYVELRRQLAAKGYTFRSHGDTEVLLAAYAEWGAECVSRLVGMFAFAVLDTRQRQLFLARDPFGIKPLYYTRVHDQVVFASDMQALLTYPGTGRLIQSERAYLYLRYGVTDHGSETLLSDIRQLDAASYMHISLDDRRIHAPTRYWRLATDRVLDISFDEAARQLRDLFFDNIRLHLRSDVPVATALSGGIDSSAIVAAMRHVGGAGLDLHAFSYISDDERLSEERWIDIVGSATKATVHKVRFVAEDFHHELPRLIRIQGEPFGSTSIFAQYLVFREAARHGIKLMLDGQGGDELFAGYRAAYGYRLADLLARGEVVELGRELGAFWARHGSSPLAAAGTLARPFLPEGLGAAARARLKGSAALAHPDLRVLGRDPEANGSPFPDRLRRHLAQTLSRRGLPELLRYEDRNSMAHSIEARVPFLDHRLVELAYSLDGAQLIARGETKAVLRRALEDLLPPTVRDRRDKLGFVTPEGRFMRETLGDLAAETFGSPEFRERALVAPDAAQERLRRHRAGDANAGMELWRALNVELWARAFLDA